MPNWPLSQGVRSHIRLMAIETSERNLKLARMKFPLTIEEVQHSCSGLTMEQLATLVRLHDEKIDIPTYKDVRVSFLRHVFHELKRAVVIRMILPKQIFLHHATPYVDNALTPGNPTFVTATMDHLSSEKCQSVIAWVNNLLRQTRLHEIVHNCVDDILHERLTPTAAHLKAVWPMLTTLIKPDISSNQADEKRLQVWVDRFRNLPTRALASYEPTLLTQRKYSQLIQVCDMQLTAGQMIGRPTFSNRDIQAWIEAWERIEGDLTWPLPNPE